MLRLHVAPATGEPFERPLDDAGSGSFTVGRARECDLSLPDRFLSRRHARIYRDPADGGRWWIEDLGSQNGTYVDDVRIDEPTELRAGGVVRLSGSLLTVVADGVAFPAARSVTPSAMHRHPETLVLRSASDILAERTEPPTDSNATAEALARYGQRLGMLNEVHQALSRSIALREVFDLILDRVFEHLRPEEAAIYLGGPGDGLELAAVRSTGERGAGAAESQFFSRSLAREVTEKGLAALVIDARTDERFAAAESMVMSGVRSIAAAPLLGPDGVQGMIALASRFQVRQFEESDLELLVSLASVAALHIHNRSLAADAAERHRLARELALARRLQVGLLPSALPEVAGWELHGGSVPNQEVSGDYYLVTPRDDGRLVLMVVDVSGKGIAAALLTASVEALAAGFLEVGLPPEEVCDRVCRGLARRTPPEKFATAFVAVLDAESGALRYASAGHDPVILVRGGGVDLLGSTGPPLGLIADATRTGVDTVLEPGDLLVLYTDGITEATAPATDEEYGRSRLAALCTEQRHLPLDELARAVEDDLIRFTGGAPFADDRTLVLARRRRPESAA